MFAKSTKNNTEHMDMPPRLSDFSERAINKAVTQNGLSHWLTLYPPALGLPFGLAALLFNMPILYSAMIGSLSIGLASAIINIFYRRDTVAGKYLAQLNKQLKKQEKSILASLQKNLHKSLTVNGAEHFARQGLSQSQKIQEKFKNIQDLLEIKLRKGELTFARFAGAAEQLYLSTLDNLRQISTILQSVSSIDKQYIDERIAHLSGLAIKTESDDKELFTLEKRMAIREKQLQKISDMLTINEEAMTKMEETTASIAEMQTDEKLAAIDYESAIHQLQEMTQRAHIYK